MRKKRKKTLQSTREAVQNSIYYYRAVETIIHGSKIIGSAVYVGIDTPIIFPYIDPTTSRIVLKTKGRNKKAYLPIYCGFDIETTNIITGDNKQAYMYQWQVAIATDDDIIVYLGRTWAAFERFIDALNKHYGLCRAVRLIMWIANMGFEYQFIRKHLEWECDEYSFFAKEERKPLLATYKGGGLEFREALSISGGSLAQLAKDYCKTQKLKGDLNYNKLRTPKTPLFDRELDYCINDVVILSEFSAFIFATYIKPYKFVPLTKTGILRRETRKELELYGDNAEAYKYIVGMCFPDELTYKVWFRWLFRGGFVHANFALANKILTNCLAFDITSSYPARMNLSYYPVTPFKAVKYNSKYLKTHCCIMLVDFFDIRAATHHSIESSHKLIESDGVKLDNGRVYYADRIRVMLTELDYDNYSKFYKWTKMNVLTFEIAKRGSLPKFLIDVLNRHYEEKAKLKEAGLSGTAKYAITKSGVNAAYGLLVTRLSLDKVNCDGDKWTTDPLALDYHAEAMKQILLPQWGIYVSAHARHELLAMLFDITVKCGDIVAYCDTDSIKCLYDNRVFDIIEKYNKMIAQQLNDKGLVKSAFSDLGMFDNEYKEHSITRFKTLGAKRYLTEIDGKQIKVTIAGLPKHTLLKWSDDPFKDFDINGMCIEAEASDKLTTAYIDEPTTAIINGVRCSELSSVALYEIPFSMLTERTYYELLVNGIEKRNKLGDYKNEN